MAELLTVENFGPIKSAKIDLRRQMVFVGHQASGKSTIAKLISIFRNDLLIVEDEEKNNYKNYFKNYNIHNYFTENTLLHFENEDYAFSFKNDKFELHKTPDFSSRVSAERSRLEGFLKKWLELNNDDKIRSRYSEEASFNLLMRANWQSLVNILKQQIYIPAERILVSMMEVQPTFARTTALPVSLTDFATSFYIARNDIKELDFDFLGVQYKYEKNGSKLYFDRVRSIELAEAASGHQAVIPMLLVISHLLSRPDKRYSFIIEEPELNLYPQTQHDVLKRLVAYSNSGQEKHDLVITTHSPYFLAVMNNMLFSRIVATKEAEQVKAVLAENTWIDGNEFNAYHLGGGTATQIFDRKTGLISTNELDNISENIAGEYDVLMSIYQSRKSE